MKTIIAVALLAGISAILRWAIADYQRWVALGVGGLPHSVGGWLVMTALRLFKRDGIKAKQLQPLINTDDDQPYLGQVLKRAGSRPVVPPHTIPQRQLSETISSDNLRKLQTVFDEVIQQQSDKLVYKKSFYEKHTDAITLCHPECGHVYGKTSSGEVAHIHPVDGSMHMILSPSDALKAIDAGWGELHGLAGFMGKLPASYTFVYAPRDAQEMGVVKQLLAASVAHMTEVRRQSP